MSINIYKSEKEAGLEKAIAASTNIVYASLATPCSVEQDEESIKNLIIESNASSNPDQFDLYYLDSVLVSTGWNKNDDVFDKYEVWKARKTPEDKQFNFMHDESDIIGHITANMVIGSDGKEVSDDLPPDDLPDNFDIVTSAVLYNSWSSEDRRERMVSIIQEIKDGKWFVSMECLFQGFDYAVVTPDDQAKIVTRNEASAFLTKHLRAYGGQGEYDGYRIGRLLRRIAFSGKGLVSNPANPKSVIFKDTNPFLGVKAESIFESKIMEKSNMSEDTLLQKQLEELKAELADAKSREDALKSELQGIDEKELRKQLASLGESVAVKEEEISVLKEATEAFEGEKKTLTDELSAATEELSTLKSELDEIKAEAHRAKRLAALTAAGLDEEAAAEKLEKFSSVDDETFEEIVSLVSQTIVADDKAGYPPKCDEGHVEKDGECVPEASATEDAESEDDEIDDSEAVAEEEHLEDVEEVAEAALADAGDADSLEAARTAASQWIRGNVLRTTSKLES